MSLLDWAVFVAFLLWVVWDGMRRGAKSKDLDGYFAGNRQVGWLAAGLSIMATQASAITIIGTSGQGCESGMDFVQTYLGLAFAMVLLSIFFVPMYHKSPVLTAYQYLETRFGLATRMVASLIFLLSRCLALGLVIYTPGVVLSALLEIDVTVTVICAGLLTTLYTMVGGVRAVIATDVKQMCVIIGGLGLVGIMLLVEVVPEFGLVGSLDALGAMGKLNAVEVQPEHTGFVPQPQGSEGQSFWEEKYNIWTGLFGGLFLMLSYFGCDQSQVQRILSNPDQDSSRRALLVSAIFKVPMQGMVLFIGALLYLFFVLNPAPLFYNPNDVKAVEGLGLQDQVQAIRVDFERSQQRQKALALQVAKEGAREVDAEVLREYQAVTRQIKSQKDAARALLARARAQQGGVVEADLDKVKTPKETNYIFPHYILNHVPVLILGLLMAAIFAAMMSSFDSALNGLTAASVVDFYRRLVRPDASEAQSMLVSRVMTVFWGLASTAIALAFKGSGSVIEMINKVGSYFYGSLLGVFVLGMMVRRAGPRAGLCGILAGMATVLWVDTYLKVGYLWYNAIGCIAVLIVGWMLSFFEDLSAE